MSTLIPCVEFHSSNNDLKVRQVAANSVFVWRTPNSPPPPAHTDPRQMMEINPLHNRKLFRFTFLALYNLFLQQQLWKHKCARCVWQLAWEQQTMRCCWVIYSLLIWWGVSLRRLKKKNRLQCVVQQSHEFRLFAALFWILLIIKYEKCVFNVLLLLKYPFSSWVQTWTPHKKCFVLCIHTFLHLSTSDPE